MSFHSESDMMSKELQTSDSIYVNLMTDVFIIIAKYRHLSSGGNRALTPMLVVQIRQWLLIVILSVVKLFSFFVKS